MGAIWGKTDFLGILGVKTLSIIGQKRQNSARYSRGILRQSLTPSPPQKKENMFLNLRLLYQALFLLFCPKILKRHLIMSQISQESHKSALFYGRNLRKIDIFGNFVHQIAPIMECFPTVWKFNSFKNTLDHRAKKTIKCPVLWASFEWKYRHNLRKKWLFSHFWCKNT